MTTATFHPIAPSPTVLACDLCGCLVDPSEQGRSLHQAWHNQTVEVIDLTGRVAQQLDRLAEAS